MNADQLFSYRGLSLDRLASFLRAAEAGGIAKTAPGQPIVQSQISRQIRELEDFFGHRLFERRGRGLVLTATGEHLAREVRGLFDGLADVVREADRAPAPWSIGAGDSLLHWWIIPRLPRVLAGVAASSVELRSLPAAAIAEQLAEGRLELGVLTERRAAGLTLRSLGTIEDLLFVPRALLPKRRATLADVIGLVPLALQDTEPELNAPLERAARRLGVKLDVALRADTLPQTYRALETGAYAAVLPAFSKKDLPVRRYARFSLGEKRPLSLAWDPRLLRRRPSAAAMIDRLVATLAR